MSEVFEVIEKRRSVRKFMSQPVEKEKIIKIIEAARLSPSASNRQPWRFVVVTDRELLSRVVKESLGVINRWARSAPLIIVGCSVRKSLISHYIGEAIIGVHYHLIDVAIALEHLVLEAGELGLSTCWIGWFNARRLKRILNIPMAWKIVSLIAVGYAHKDLEIRPRKRLPLEKILTFR